MEAAWRHSIGTHSHIVCQKWRQSPRGKFANQHFSSDNNRKKKQIFLPQFLHHQLKIDIHFASPAVSALFLFTCDICYSGGTMGGSSCYSFYLEYKTSMYKSAYHNHEREQISYVCEVCGSLSTTNYLTLVANYDFKS